MIEFESKVKVDLTPEKLAELFSHLDDGEQARFYNHLGEIAMDWRGGLCLQMCYVGGNKKLTPTGRATMVKIGEWGNEGGGE